MKIQMIGTNNHRETIEDVTTVVMPCTETGVIEIQTKTQKTLRKIEELNCFQITPVHTKTASVYLTITKVADEKPESEFDMLRKIWFDHHYGRQKIYVEGFYDDDGKGKFHEGLGEVVITNRTIKGANIPL